jgi:hypothetical protein
MDPTSIAGDELNKRITTLETEVKRLKPFEPKPASFGYGALFIALAVGVILGAIFR